jgi:hypothetical protein
LSSPPATQEREKGTRAYRLFATVAMHEGDVEHLHGRPAQTSDGIELVN